MMSSFMYRTRAPGMKDAPHILRNVKERRKPAQRRDTALILNSMLLTNKCGRLL